MYLVISWTLKLLCALQSPLAAWFKSWLKYLTCCRFFWSWRLWAFLDGGVPNGSTCLIHFLQHSLSTSGSICKFAFVSFFLAINISWNGKAQFCHTLGPKLGWASVIWSLPLPYSSDIVSLGTDTHAYSKVKRACLLGLYNYVLCCSNTIVKQQWDTLMQCILNPWVIPFLVRSVSAKFFDTLLHYCYIFLHGLYRHRYKGLCLFVTSTAKDTDLHWCLTLTNHLKTS